MAPTFVEGAGGFALPAKVAGGPLPGDLLRSYVTADEILGPTGMGLDDVVATLRSQDLRTVLHVCANLLESLDQNPIDRDRDLSMARMLKTPFGGRAESAVNTGRALVWTGSVLVLAKLALLHCRATPRPGLPDSAPWILLALLAIQNDRGAHPTKVELAGIQGDAGVVLALIQTQTLLQRLDPVTLLGHHVVRWRNLPKRQAGLKGSISLERQFETATGVSLNDFVSVGLAIWVQSDRQQSPLLSADNLGLKLRADKVRRAVAMLSASPTRLRRAIRVDHSQFGIEWSFDSLRRYPVVRLRGGHLLVLSRRLILERVFSLVRWDIETYFKESGRKHEAEQAVGFWRRMCELDALESLAAIAGDTPLGRRLFREADLMAAFANKGTQSQTADFAIDYPGAWVVGDITTSTLTRQTVIGGHVEALQRDLGKIEAKARQIESTIGDLRRDESRLTGVDKMPRGRYVPVLVMAEGFAINAATSAAIDGRLKAAGVLQGPQVAPLHVLDVEELSMVEALADSGTSLLNILEQHERGNFHGMSLRDFILIEARLKPGRSARIKRLYEKAWAPVFDAVGLEAPRSGRPD